MFRSVVIFLFSMGLTCPQAESGVLSGVSKAARIAKEVSKTASKAAASQKKILLLMSDYQVLEPLD